MKQKYKLPFIFFIWRLLHHNGQTHESHLYSIKNLCPHKRRSKTVLLIKNRSAKHYGNNSYKSKAFLNIKKFYMKSNFLIVRSVLPWVFILYFLMSFQQQKKNVLISLVSILFINCAYIQVNPPLWTSCWRMNEIIWLWFFRK